MENKDEILEALDSENNSYTIDLPNPYNIEGGWINIDNFTTHEEAVDFVRKYFGADDEGKISLISTT